MIWILNRLEKWLFKYGLIDTIHPGYVRFVIGNTKRLVISKIYKWYAFNNIKNVKWCLYYYEVQE